MKGYAVVGMSYYFAQKAASAEVRMWAYAVVTWKYEEKDFRVRTYLQQIRSYLTNYERQHEI